ncbi:calcium-binding protein [Ramlibacter sp. PS3R-8]|uniref:calcium-binding protein n=1 Tax=Ramlibacter sp. PS3R-8 TaxID=3133437 RepID=UPI0030B70CC8
MALRTKRGQSIFGDRHDNWINGGTGDDTLVGGSGRDSLFGGDGNDYLDGGAHVDVMRGGAGDDTYVAHQTGDRILEEADAGIDTVLSYARSFKLDANVEIGRIMSTERAHMNGNALDNVIYAGVGNNVMNGGAGTDTVSFEFGVSGDAGVRVNLASPAVRDTGGSGRDKVHNFENLVGSANDDWLGGDSGNNMLDGLGGNDTLLGADGNDSLEGGAGNDMLEGGAGNDTFDFDAATDMSTDPAATDVIGDFVVGEDLIDLSGIDAMADTLEDDGFTFIGAADFSGTDAAAELRYTFDAAAGIGYLSGSTDADADAEFVIQVVGVTELSATDLVL